MRKGALFGGWIVVVAMATTLTWQVVGAVDDQVSDRPVSPLNVGAPATAASPTSVPTGPTTTTLMSPSTSLPHGSSTTTAPDPASTSSTTSTASAPPWQTKSTTTSGGTVVVRYRPGEVVLDSATPAAGFRAEIEKLGPPDVEVEFESDELKVNVRIRWEDGELDIRVDESAEG